MIIKSNVYNLVQFFRDETSLTKSKKKQLKYLFTSETAENSRSWFSILEVSVVVHHVTEANVVEVVLVAEHNIKFLLNHQKFPGAHQTPQVELAQDAVELELRDSAVVHAVVVLEERENLNAADAHAVRQSMHD